MKVHKNKNKKRGIILAEALLTIIILSIGLVAIIQSYLSSYRASILTKDYVLATMLLQNKMYEIMQLSSIKAEEKEDGDFPEPFERFHYSLESHAVTDREFLKDINQLTLKVSWTAGRKKNNIETATFLLSETP